MRNSIFVLLVLSLTACTAPTEGTTGASTLNSQAVSPASAPAPNPCSAANTPFGGGSGTAADPYLICTTAQLRSLALGAYTYTSAKLMAGIALGAADGSATAGLGDFYGTLDGNGQTVGGLKGLTGTQGLFTSLYGTVKNLNLTYMTINCGTSACGALAGIIESGASVDNVTVQSSTVSGFQSIGGIAGSVYGTLTHAYTWTTAVTATSFFSGGIAGQVLAGGVVSGNSASGTYSAALDQGFVVGSLQGTLTCIQAAGHTWTSNNSVGATSGAGNAIGCL